MTILHALIAVGKTAVVQKIGQIALESAKDLVTKKYEESGKEKLEELTAQAKEFKSGVISKTKVVAEQTSQILEQGKEAYKANGAEGVGKFAGEKTRTAVDMIDENAAKFGRAASDITNKISSTLSSYLNGNKTEVAKAEENNTKKHKI